MTKEEKQIWAMAFTIEMSKTLDAGPPAHVLKRDRERHGLGITEHPGPWAIWEREQASSAVERAAAIVCLFRECEELCREGFEGTDTHEMYEAMRAGEGLEG